MAPGVTVIRCSLPATRGLWRKLYLPRIGSVAPHPALVLSQGHGSGHLAISIRTLSRVFPGGIKFFLTAGYDHRVTDTHSDAATTDGSFVKDWLDKSDTFFLKNGDEHENIEHPEGMA